MRVLFFYYYTFYKKVFKETDSLLYASLIISLSQSFIIFILIESMSAFFFCRRFLELNSLISITIVINLYNAYHYLYRKKGEQIIDEAPLLFNSPFISVMGSILFFLGTFAGFITLHDLADWIIKIRCIDK